MKFNINEYVKVRLTEYGHKVHRKDHEEFLIRTGVSPERFPYIPPKEDSEGWSKWQMWALMQTFGSSIRIGREPFSTEIEIETPCKHFWNDIGEGGELLRECEWCGVQKEGLDEEGK